MSTANACRTLEEQEEEIKGGRGHREEGVEEEQEEEAEVMVVLDSEIWPVKRPCVRTKLTYLSPEGRQ